MFKRLAPLFTVLLSVLLDTSVIHVLYHGVYLLPLSLVIVVLISMLLGRTWGVLYGLLAGLIMDVSAGTLGLKLFGYIAIGFLVGLMLDQQDHRGMIDGEQKLRYSVSRIIWVAIFIGLYELVMLIYQYFSTAVFDWRFAGNMLLRIGIMDLLCQLLYVPLRRLYLGKRSQFASRRNTREVKNY